MKKKLYLLPLFLLFALLQMACSDDGLFIHPDKEFDVSTKSLNFPSGGGAQIVSIVSGKDIDWKAYSSISWIKLDEPDYTNGTIRIVAEPNNEIDQTKGTVTVYATPGKSEQIQVTRAGLGIIHDRPSISRMNLKGNVSKLSYHLNPAYIFEVALGELTNLEFNENGMLISFVNKYQFTEELTITYINTLKYDSQNRLTQLEAIGDAIIEDTGEKPTHILDFTYGSHGKYIDTRMLTDRLQLLYCNSDWRVWLPKMIKNLTGIGIYSNAVLEFPTSAINIDISGDEGVVHFLYTVDGEGQSAPLAKYLFDGNFLKQMEYMGIVMGREMILTNDYLIDAKTGNILSVKTAEMFGSDALSEERYTNDITNQRLYYYDMFIGYDLTVEFNDKMDIVKMDNANGFKGSGEFEYLYDKNGNWTNITAKSLITGHIDELNKNRSIEYRQE